MWYTVSYDLLQFIYSATPAIPLSFGSRRERSVGCNDWSFSFTKKCC